MTLDELYKEAVTTLKIHEIENSELDARLLVLHHTGFEHADLIANGDVGISDNTIELVYTDVERRIAGEPLFRILGAREFWGLDFKVTPDTLDPRPDTEILVECALKWLKSSGVLKREKQVRLIDLGTGTGCILISLIHELRHKYDIDVYGVGVDFSHNAALVAQENVRKHNLQDCISIVRGDWLTAFAPDNFHLILSNPPYIPNLDIENLSKEVQNHDPILALSGGNDGLECYKKIISQFKTHLNEANRGFLEIGIGQLNDLSHLVDESNLRLCDSGPDLSGIPRVVEISSGDN